MKTEIKFDPKKLQKLNNPQRLIDIPVDFICSKLQTKQPDTVVEIGAGTAFFSIAFLRNLHPSAMYASDISETMIAWVNENVLPDYPDIITVRNEESNIPIASGIADLVYMITLHHELENPLQMLREGHRILKPGGEIFIVDWEKKEMTEGPPENIRCLPDQVRNELLQTGFDNVSIYNELAKHWLVIGQKPRDSAG